MSDPAIVTKAVPPAQNAGLAAHAAVALFAVVVLAWGTTWPVMKLIVQELPLLIAALLIVGGIALGNNK